MGFSFLPFFSSDSLLLRAKKAGICKVQSQIIKLLLHRKEAPGNYLFCREVHRMLSAVQFCRGVPFQTSFDYHWSEKDIQLVNEIPLSVKPDLGPLFLNIHQNKHKRQRSPCTCFSLSHTVLGHFDLVLRVHNF